MIKKILIIAGAVLLAAAIAGGSFYGGMAYQRSQVNNIRDQFLRERGLEGDPSQAGGFPGANGDLTNRPAGGFPGGGITGQVKSITGNTLSLSTPQDVTTVTLSDETTIEMASAATASDIQPGQQVMVTGTRDNDGNITAVRVYILGSAAPGEAQGSTP